MAAHTVEEYLDTLTTERHERMVELVDLARRAAPQATGAIRWGHPAFLHADGVILFTLSGHARHANVVFTPSTKNAFTDELADLETGKGSVKLPYDAEVPTDLLRRMIAYRIDEHEVHGIGWM